MAHVKAKFLPLAMANQSEAYSWLEMHAPDYLTALEQAVEQGATPEEVYRFMLTDAGIHRQEIAKRLQLAAGHVLRLMEQ